MKPKCIISFSDILLPEPWKQTLPKEDQLWLSKALFRVNPFNGRPELDPDRATKLWYYPPQPICQPSHPPKVDRYFAKKLLLWMPRRLWRVRLVCTEELCSRNELTGAGLYRTTRQVFDIDGTYNMAAEYYECSKCKKKFISWSLPLVKQLTLGQQLQFPCVLTYRYTCDGKVVRLLRHRGMGNSTNQMALKLKEQHGEAWMRKTIHYLTDAEAFVKAESSGLIQAPKFDPPPLMTPLPDPRWFLHVYGRDVMSRLPEVKAAITSTLGNVLKMDSTKKVRTSFNKFNLSCIKYA
jgi:hypothetical protein